MIGIRWLPKMFSAGAWLAVLTVVVNGCGPIIFRLNETRTTGACPWSEDASGIACVSYRSTRQSRSTLLNAPERLEDDFSLCRSKLGEIVTSQAQRLSKRRDVTVEPISAQLICVHTMQLKFPSRSSLERAPGVRTCWNSGPSEF
jgi:hypothetical protein